MPPRLMVTLEQDMPEDYVRMLLDSMSMFPGVVSVDLGIPVEAQMPNILYIWMRSTRNVPPQPEPT